MSVCGAALVLSLSRSIARHSLALLEGDRIEGESVLRGNLAQ